MQEQHEKCFSKNSLARYIDKSVRWVEYRLAGPQPPPGYRIGRSWIFKKSEIDAWLEQFRAGADLEKIANDVIADLRGAK